MSRSRGSTSFATVSPMRMVPSVTSSRPATIRRAVVFPHPDGPTKTMNSPSRTSRLNPSTARVPSGKTFATPSNVTDANVATAGSSP